MIHKIKFIILLLMLVCTGNLTCAQNTPTSSKVRKEFLKKYVCSTPTRQRCPSKPVMCLYGSNFVTIELPPDVIFAEIEISSDNNSIISGDITQDYPTLNFAELTGNYTIVLNTHSDDSTIITY